MKERITDNVDGQFSIRSYTRQTKRHAHNYHQIVIPVQGSIVITVGDYHGLVSVGDCVVIQENLSHEFCAAEDARFLVIDTKHLPSQAYGTEAIPFSLSSSLLAFVHFIEQQLIADIPPALIKQIYTIFYELLSVHEISTKRDKRIEKAIALITENLSQTYTNSEIAKHVYLSTTQFKHLFTTQMGMSCQSYTTQLRMNKAKALLSYTDTPINIIAEQVGYSNASAFSRKFREHVGVSPSRFHQ